LITLAPSSAAGTLAMVPPNLPTAVRSAAVITTSFIAAPSVAIPRPWNARLHVLSCGTHALRNIRTDTPCQTGDPSPCMMRTRMKISPCHGPAGDESSGGPGGRGAADDGPDPLPALQGRLLHVSHMATIGEMAAGVAHELNQPLTAIANYAQ